MDVTENRIPGLLVFTPTPHPDDRGFFSRTFDADDPVAARGEPGRGHRPDVPQTEDGNSQ
jgi:dTDP-4-dehydrorhamnose 3,5-epimerase